MGKEFASSVLQGWMKTVRRDQPWFRVEGDRGSRGSIASGTLSLRFLIQSLLHTYSSDMIPSIFSNRLLVAIGLPALLSFCVTWDAFAVLEAACADYTYYMKHDWDGSTWRALPKTSSIGPKSTACHTFGRPYADVEVALPRSAAGVLG